MTRDRLADAETFLRQEYDAVYRYVCCILGDREDALEVVQESCLRFCQAGTGEGIEHHERALLSRIARNLALDVIRKRKVRAASPATMEFTRVLVLRPPNPEQLLLEDERHRLARKAYEQLDGRQKESLALRTAGCSYQEIAQTLGLSPESVGPTLARALRKFRTLYEALVEPKVANPEDASARRR